jgi:hypothetical protein
MLIGRRSPSCLWPESPQNRFLGASLRRRLFTFPFSIMLVWIPVLPHLRQEGPRAMLLLDSEAASTLALSSSGLIEAAASSSKVRSTYSKSPPQVRVDRGLLLKMDTRLSLWIFLDSNFLFDIRIWLAILKDCVTRSKRNTVYDLVSTFGAGAKKVKLAFSFTRLLNIFKHSTQNN